MKVLQFKCTLLSDVILNRKSATTGPNETLDFIPGSNFLGITASKLYQNLEAEEASILFHSGKVRFGDAHPSRPGFRGLRVPAAMFYPKLSKPEKELYIHNLIPENNNLGSKQLKQCRKGFYDFSSSPVAPQIKAETNFAIKSAYDREARRSKDEQLYGYESLQKGLVMYFAVEIDDDVSIPDIEKMITGALDGKRQIGRSRTAQYGLVEIKELKEEVYREVKSGKPSGNCVTVYADSRLIFLDEYGMHTFQPTAAQLGLDGVIDWNKSQIRTFCYAPWNFKRQSFDTDRCGIEKGSVLVVTLNEGAQCPGESCYIGMYKNEGFGRVIYNPDFLKGNDKGEAIYRLDTSPNVEAHNDIKASENVNISLLKYLEAEKKAAEEKRKVYNLVNKWVKDNAKKFNKEKFSSQWGSVRSLAMSASDIGNLKYLLFNNKPTQTGYLVHGVAKEKWDAERLKALSTFVDDLIRRVKEKELNPIMAKLAIVNLAAEMAKKCK